MLKPTADVRCALPVSSTVTCVLTVRPLVSGDEIRYYFYEGYLWLLVFFPNILVELHLWQSHNLAPQLNLIGYDTSTSQSKSYWKHKPNCRSGLELYEKSFIPSFFYSPNIFEGSFALNYINFSSQFYVLHSLWYCIGIKHTKINKIKLTSRTAPCKKWKRGKM